MSTKKLEFHPFAELFPLMKGPAMKEFTEKIKLEGQRDPVVLLDGKVLDGRNRYYACQELDISVIHRDYDPKTDGASPLGFVIGHNLDRRHLDDAERARVAAKLALLSKQNLKSNGKILTAADAAALLNVSKISVVRAKKVAKDAIKAIQVMAEEGTVSASVAAAVAGLPKHQQEELVKAGPDAIRKEAGKRLNPKRGESDKGKVKREEKEQKLSQEQKLTDTTPPKDCVVRSAVVFQIDTILRQELAQEQARRFGDMPFGKVLDRVLILVRNLPAA